MSVLNTFERNPFIAYEQGTIHFYFISLFIYNAGYGTFFDAYILQNALKLKTKAKIDKSRKDTFLVISSHNP